MMTIMIQQADKSPLTSVSDIFFAVEHDYFGGASAPPSCLFVASQVTRDHQAGIIFAPGGLSLSALTILTVCKERERELRAFITNKLQPGWLVVVVGGGGGGSMEMSSSLVSVSRQKVINLINNQTQRGHSKQASSPSRVSILPRAAAVPAAAADVSP